MIQRIFGSEVDVYPLPEINSKALNYLTKPYKIGLFTNNIGDLQGSCLFLDLDTVIVRSIDCFFDYLPGQFCICKEWLPPNKMFLNSITGKQAGANSSVFRFEANSMQFVIDGVEQTPELLKRMRLEQRWLSHIAGDQMNWWPSSWVSSFKHRRPVYPLSLIFPSCTAKKTVVLLHLTDPSNLHTPLKETFSGLHVGYADRVSGLQTIGLIEVFDSNSDSEKLLITFR